MPSSDRETINLALLDESVDLWRPVAARKVAADAYLIPDQNSDRKAETWQFEPGTLVRCREERNDHQILVATETADRARIRVRPKNSRSWEFVRFLVGEGWLAHSERNTMSGRKPSGASPPTKSALRRRSTRRSRGSSRS